MKCKTCSKEYSPRCDYRQGRCPLHPPIIQLIKKQRPTTCKNFGRKSIDRTL